MSTNRTCAHTCQPFPSAAKGPPARPVPALPPRARPSTTARLPSCAKNFFAQSLVNSRLSLVQRSYLCNPSIRRQRPSNAARTRPARAATRAAFASLPSALLTQKFLTQSHTFSRHLSQSLVHLSCLSTPSTAPKMLLTSIPFETGTLPANQTTVSWPSRLPLRNTQYEIRNSEPNLLLPPCKSLNHRISCTHSRKPKAAADHLCTLTNVYCLTEHTTVARP